MLEEGSLDGAPPSGIVTEATGSRVETTTCIRARRLKERGWRQREQHDYCYSEESGRSAL